MQPPVAGWAFSGNAPPLEREKRVLSIEGEGPKYQLKYSLLLFEFRYSFFRRPLASLLAIKFFVIIFFMVKPLFSSYLSCIIFISP